MPPGQPPYGAPIHTPDSPFLHSGVSIGATLPWGYYSHHTPGQGIAPATPPPTPIPNPIAVQATNNVQGNGPGHHTTGDLDNHEHAGVSQMDLEQAEWKVVPAPVAPKPKRKCVHEEIQKGGEFLPYLGSKT
jgi:hypothetical protein